MNKHAAALAGFFFIALGSSARADVVTIDSTLGGMLKGTGSFSLSNDCVRCTVLPDFTFSLNDRLFEPDRMTFFTSSMSLSGSLTGMGGGRSRLVFTPSGNLQYQSEEDGHTVVLHGQYTVSTLAATGSDIGSGQSIFPVSWGGDTGDSGGQSTLSMSSGDPTLDNFGPVEAVTVVPEPAALALLLTAVILVIASLGGTCSGGKMSGHTRSSLGHPNTHRPMPYRAGLPRHEALVLPVPNAVCGPCLFSISTYNQINN